MKLGTQLLLAQAKYDAGLRENSIVSAKKSINHTSETREISGNELLSLQNHGETTTDKFFLPLTPWQPVMPKNKGPIYMTYHDLIRQTQVIQIKKEKKIGIPKYHTG